MMRQLVGKVVEQVPIDTIIKENKDKCEQSRNGSHERNLGFSVVVA
jgi:hypothetical protein